MSWYPELDSLSLSELEARFQAPPPEDPEEADEYNLWYDEVAIAIRERDPEEGARFLRGEVPGADPERLTAILLAITWFKEGDRDQADLPIECLEHPDEDVVARAIDGLAGLGGCGLTERILGLGADARPWVRGAVLRFAAQVVPDRAPALLLDALTDPHYVVRENAVDELEELDYAPALARVEGMRGDPHPDVRQAALAAIANLGGANVRSRFCSTGWMTRTTPFGGTPSASSASSTPRPRCRASRRCAQIDTPACVGRRSPPSTKLAAPDRAIALLVGALRDSDATVRLSALDDLDRREQFTDRAVFERMLEDPDEDVRNAARSGLSQLPHSAQPQ